MKLSQPNSARIINTARVLSALRKTPLLSKADLARVLELNKVSTGEIVDSLLEKGLVREAGKIDSSNGRKATSLEIAGDAAFVLAVYFGEKTTETALCTLGGRIVKMERLPSDFQDGEENFYARIIKSCMRNMKLVKEDIVYGLGLSCDAVHEESRKSESLKKVLEQFLKKEVVKEEASSALIAAEKAENLSMDEGRNLLYLNWGTRISLSLYSGGNTASSSSSFGRMKVSNTETLEEICALEDDGNPWEKTDKNSLSMMAKALRTANRVTGSSRVICGGTGSSIPKDFLEELNSLCPGMKIEASVLGERALLRGACSLALDRFFYMTSLLDGVKDYL